MRSRHLLRCPDNFITALATQLTLLEFDEYLADAANHFPRLGSQFSGSAIVPLSHTLKLQLAYCID